MARKYSSAPSKNGFAVLMGAIVVIVLVLAVVAVKGKIASNVKENRIADGNVRISDLEIGISPEELIAECGLDGNSSIKPSTKLEDFTEALTLKNYAKYISFTNLSGLSSYVPSEGLTDENISSFKEASGLGDKVTLDTTDMEVKNAYGQYLYSLQQASQQMQQNSTSDGAAAIPAADEGAADTAGAADAAGAADTADAPEAE